MLGRTFTPGWIEAGLGSTGHCLSRCGCGGSSRLRPIIVALLRHELWTAGDRVPKFPSRQAQGPSRGGGMTNLADKGTHSESQGSIGAPTSRGCFIYAEVTCRRPLGSARRGADRGPTEPAGPAGAWRWAAASLLQTGKRIRDIASKPSRVIAYGPLEWNLSEG